MNAMGKEIMAKRITVTIKLTLKMNKKKPIIMKWKEDTNKDKKDPREATTGIREERDPSENQKDRVPAEASDNRQQETETVGTASRRNRKIPVTRRDDFFVDNHQQKAGKIEKEDIIKDSSQVRGNTSLNIFHQNIRGLGNKTNELYCHLQQDLPHILCLSEHHLSESELQLIHLADYSLGASYSRKTFLKGGVSIFVYRNLKYNTIKIDEHNIDKDIEACAIQLDSTLNKLSILTVYRSPKVDFTIFLKQLDLILQKLYNNKYSILICGDVNVNYLVDSNRRSQLDAVLHSYNLMDIIEFPTRYGLKRPSTMSLSTHPFLENMSYTLL